MIAIIQAGGKGARLQPYTLVLPKPLMPVGGSPVIEILIKWLRRSGIREVYITIGYLGHLIRSICGDGSQWGMNIYYSEETEPLGTVGPLKIIGDKLTDTFLVLNGDLVTDLNLWDFVDFHRKRKGQLTVAVTDKSIHVDLGVLESREGRVTSFREKPVLKYHVSMGIYCMEPQILDLIPPNILFGFDDLMYAMLDLNMPVYTFEHQGVWMDIGREEDFVKAQKAFRNQDSIFMNNANAAEAYS